MPWIPNKANLIISLADGNTSCKHQKVLRRPQTLQESHQNDTSPDSTTVNRLNLSSKGNHDGEAESDSEADSEDNLEEEQNEEMMRVSCK